MALEFNPRGHSPWLNTEEAAARLGVRPGTMKNWRHRGEGPKYSKMNQRLVRYHESNLDLFIRTSSDARDTDNH